MSKLLGDMTEDALKALGADKIAKFYQRTTGRACNCAGRKQILNNLHRAAQRIVERQKVRPPAKVTTPEEHQQPTKPVDEV